MIIHICRNKKWDNNELKKIKGNLYFSCSNFCRFSVKCIYKYVVWIFLQIVMLLFLCTMYQC